MFGGTLNAQADVLTRDIAFHLDGREIVGTLTVPEDEDRPPIVLILHGMSGDRQGPQVSGGIGTLFSQTSQVLAENGIASLRFSTGGRGGSEGLFSDMTLERRIQETVKAVEWVSQQERFNLDEISILGHSQGALIAVSAAMRVDNPLQIKSLVLWAPQSNALNTYRGRMGVVKYQKGINAKPDEIVSWGGVGGTLRAFKRDFFTGLAKVKTLDDIARFNGRLLVVTGTRDRWSTSASAQVFKHRHLGETKLLEFDVGHRMGAQIGAASVTALAKSTALWLLAGK